MWQKAGERENWIMRTACILLVMVLISIRLICGTYARFVVEDTGDDGARVADFSFEMNDKDNSHYLDLSEIKKPGDVLTYTFTVSNQEGSTVSEVAEEYIFTVQLNGSMPLLCAISGGNPAREVLRATISEDTQSLPVDQSAVAGQFPASVGRTDTYTMTVQWPEEENDAKYASRSAVAEAVLTVTAEQID